MNNRKLSYGAKIDMGTVVSSMTLLGGSLLCGVFSAVAANYARQGNLSQAKMWAWITAAIAIALILLTLFLVVKGHSFLGGLAFGVTLSYILMTLVMVAVAALNILSAIQAGENNQDRSKVFSIGAATAAFGGFVLSLFLIIFLL